MSAQFLHLSWCFSSFTFSPSAAQDIQSLPVNTRAGPLSLANIRYFPIFIKPAHVCTESNNSLESSQNILNIKFCKELLVMSVQSYRHKAPPPSSQTSPCSSPPPPCSGTRQCRSSSAPSSPAPAAPGPPCPPLSQAAGPRHTGAAEGLLVLWEPSS